MVSYIILRRAGRTPRRTGRAVWLTATLAAVLVAGAAGWALRTGGAEPDTNRPGHTTEHGSGLVDGDGPVRVEVWFTLGCPDCAGMRELARVLDRLVADGTVTRVYRPAVADPALIPLAATIGCAADRGAHPAYLDELLANDGVHKADKLIYLAGTAGLIDPAFARCVRAGHYRSWASELPSAPAEPPVRVDGAAVAADPEVVRSAVQAAADRLAR